MLFFILLLYLNTKSAMRRVFPILILVVFTIACTKPTWHLVKLEVLEIPSYCQDDFTPEGNPDIYFALYDEFNNLYFASRDTFNEVGFFPIVFTMNIQVYEQFYDIAIFDYDELAIDDLIGSVVFEKQIKAGTFSTPYNEKCSLSGTDYHLGELKIKITLERRK